MELGRGLEIGQQEFSKYIPGYLGRFCLWLPPQQLEELLGELIEDYLCSSNGRVVSAALDTVGVIYEEYDTYRVRFPEEDAVYRRRRERLLGMLLKGLAGFRAEVRQEALFVLGRHVFGSENLGLHEKRRAFLLTLKKILALIGEDQGGELTFYYRAAMLGRIYRFLTEQETDSQTPDVPGDGRAFYGRDALANYFIIGMQQLGVEIFHVENGQLTLNVPKEELRRLWENYYVPMVKGYFGAYGSFRSDDVKTGNLLAYTGSTSSAMYFPGQVELDDGSHAIDYIVMAAPVFQGGRRYAVQQGAGMVVCKSDEKHEYASVEFLKWFTETENNLRFGCISGYLPVRKEANSVEKLDQVIEKQDLDVAAKTYECLTTVFREMEDMTLYTNRSFENGSAARKILEYHLADRAAEDRAGVAAAMEQGQSLEEASAPYVTEEAFEAWYGAFCDALESAVGE